MLRILLEQHFRYTPRPSFWVHSILEVKISLDEIGRERPRLELFRGQTVGVVPFVFGCRSLLMSDSQSSDTESRLSRLLPDALPMRDRGWSVLSRLKARARLARRRLRGSGDGSLAERLDAIDPSFVEEGAREISEADVETVVEEADAIEERFRDNGPLRRFLDDGRLLLALVRDAWDGRYRQVPWWSVSGAAFALLYVLNPLDLIPDALPLIGVLDDAAVVSACLVLIEQDLADYRAWRDRSGPPSLGEGEPGELTSG